MNTMEKETYEINLDYIEFHPGETLKEKLQEMNTSTAEFAEKAHVSEAYVQGVIACKNAITPETAVAFEMTTQIPARLWLQMQHDYDNFMLKQKKQSWIEQFMHFSKRNVAIL